MSNESESLAGGRARLPQGVRDLLAALAGRHLVGNALGGPVDGACRTVLDPATGRALAQAPAAAPEPDPDPAPAQAPTLSVCFTTIRPHWSG